MHNNYIVEGLKSCPFCGSAAYLHHDSVYGNYFYYGECGFIMLYFIKCNKCTASISADTLEDVKNLWNSRLGM